MKRLLAAGLCLLIAAGLTATLTSTARANGHWSCRHAIESRHTGDHRYFDHNIIFEGVPIARKKDPVDHGLVIGYRQCTKDHHMVTLPKMVTVYYSLDSQRAFTCGHHIDPLLGNFSGFRYVKFTVMIGDARHTEQLPSIMAHCHYGKLGAYNSISVSTGTLPRTVLRGYTGTGFPHVKVFITQVNENWKNYHFDSIHMPLNPHNHSKTEAWYKARFPAKTEAWY